MRLSSGALEARPRTRLRLALVVAVLLGFSLGSGGVMAEARRVLVVLSRDAEPYRAVRDALSARLEGSGVTVAVVTAESGPGQVRRALTNPPQAVVALGALASETVLAQGAAAPQVRGMILGETVPGAGTVAATVSLSFSPETQLRWIHTLLPRARVVGVVYSDPTNGARVEEVRPVADALGMRLEVRRITSPTELPGALAALAGAADVLWGLPDGIAYSAEVAQHLLLFCHRNRLPVVAPSDAWVKAGALFALSWDYQDMGAQVAEVALDVMAGQPVARVVPPRVAVPVINLKTAQHLKLTLPADVLVGAKVIE